MGLASLGAGKHSKSVARQLPRWVKVLLAVIVVAAILILLSLRSLDVYRLDREAARLAALKRSLQQENAVLREEKKLLHTPGYVERIAREQLGLVKPGEIAILIVTPPTQPKSGPPTIRQEKPSWMARMVRAVKRWLSL
ncbi:MAG TPA: septum formation initiator family protein [bacterium]